MKLTGKAKEDFTKWKISSDNIFVATYNKTINILENALIIEWFDSVGIYVEIIRNDDYFDYIVMEEWDYGFETRQEATSKAIEKANMIYNNVK